MRDTSEGVQGASRFENGGVLNVWLRLGSAGWAGYVATLLIVAGSTGLAALMERHFDPPNLTMIYLLGVVVAAIAFGRGPAIAAAILSVAAFGFIFIPPRFTFRVSDTQYLVTLAVMLLVAVVIGTLTARLREQLRTARIHEHRTLALYRLNHDLAVRSAIGDIVESAAVRIAEAFESRVAVLLPDESGAVRVVAGDPSLVGDRERAVAQRAYENGRLEGFDGERARSGSGLHLPLEAGTSILGVLSIRANAPGGFQDAERFHLTRALASQTALALERCRLAEEAHRARMEAETERTRSALLSSVSHDLRTPLASITGAASSLRDGSGALSAATRRELADTISEEAQRLNHLIGNLLEMTRLESGTLRVRQEWHSLEEVVGAALARLEPRLGERPVRLTLPEDLPLISLDDVLFEQVIWNLVENANKYTPAGRPIDITARMNGGELRFEVADRGPGIRPGEGQRLFEKFYRGAASTGQAGVGLGLSICQAIVVAHGGTIGAANRQDGGAVFTIRLPLEGEPPAVESEPLAAPEAVVP